MQIKDYYRILELPLSASQADIKRNYRKLIKNWHPDICHSEESKARSQEIIEAYEILGNEARRIRYDVEYQRWKSASSIQDYKCQNSNLEQDIHEARQSAENIVQEFINDFKRRGSRARNEAWSETKKQGLSLVATITLLTLISLILGICS